MKPREVFVFVEEDAVRAGVFAACNGCCDVGQAGAAGNPPLLKTPRQIIRTTLRDPLNSAIVVGIGILYQLSQAEELPVRRTEHLDTQEFMNTPFDHPTAPSAAYREYPSGVTAGLRLFASFAPLDHAAPLLLSMHGWHGNIKSGHKDNVTPPADEIYFTVQPEMRGRGDSGAKPDANGRELQDAVDALKAARDLYPQAVAEVPPRLHGGSGGGGNVLGILGKFPDLFASAVCECGISDYALWYAHDAVGEFRDEMRDAGWIGGDPHRNPEAYLSRGGRTTARNLLTPLLLVHGTADNRVPFEQAEAYVDALRRNGKGDLARLQEFPGVGVPGHFGGMTEEMDKLRRKRIAEHHLLNSLTPRLSASGEFVVAGYLRTSRFEAELETVDQVALLRYDLLSRTFTFQAPSCKQARVRLAGEPQWQSVCCQTIALADLCNAIGVPDPRKAEFAETRSQRPAQ